MGRKIHFVQFQDFFQAIKWKMTDGEKETNLNRQGQWPVWPDKNRQMSIKYAQKWFH